MPSFAKVGFRSVVYEDGCGLEPGFAVFRICHSQHVYAQTKTHQQQQNTTLLKSKVSVSIISVAYA
jgi:hypothetical protein